jgi:sugar (pentulose or hexulose) kinase
LAATASGDEICVTSAPTPWTFENGGRATVDPDTLAASVIDLMDAAVENAADRRGAVEVSAIGVTGMAEAGVLIDDAGVPAYDVVAWFDPRGADEIAAAPEDFRAAFPGRTGLAVSPLPSLAKLLWLRAQGVTMAGRTWLSVPEFLVHRLGGQRVGEMSLLARTGLMDQDGPDVWPDALELLRADDKLVSPRVRAGTPVGRVRPGHAAPCLEGAVLTVAGHDHLAAAAGCNVTRPGELFNSLGTADTMVCPISAMPPAETRAALADRGVNVAPHVVDGPCVMLGGTKGGLILRRTLEVLGAAEGDGRERLDQVALRAIASSTAADDEAGDVMPGVTVSGAAVDDGVLRISVDADGYGPAELWLAAVDHCAREACLLYATMGDFAPRPARIVVAGGWSRMSSVQAVRARELSLAVFSERRQAGAFGAVVLAAHAAVVAGEATSNGDSDGGDLANPSSPGAAFVDSFIHDGSWSAGGHDEPPERRATRSDVASHDGARRL